MKIGVIGFELTTSGGDQRLLLRLAGGLRRLGHQVTIYAYRYSPRFCYPELSREFDIRAVHIHPDESLPACRSTRMGILGVAARRYFLESRHLARFLGNVDVLNPIGRPAHRSAVFLKRRSGIPVVWSCNDVVAWEQEDHRARIDRFTNRIVSQGMLRREIRIVNDIDATAVLSNGVRHVFEKAYGRPAHVVYAGADSDQLTEQVEGARTIRKKYNLPDAAFVALWLGILEPFRRVEDLLHATSILRQKRIAIHCLIVGRTDAARPYAARLKTMVSELGLQEQIHFVEEGIPDQEIAAYYSACDVFVFPNDQQSWGLAPLEALACHRPVIVSRGSGVHEVLRDGETALLVPPREPQVLAEAIFRIFADPELASGMSSRGYKLVSEHLTWDNFAVSMLEIMERAHSDALRRSKTSLSTNRSANWTQHMIAATEPVWRIR
jgi:D-inositol-3-phosphate glycosyltransferase